MIVSELIEQPLEYNLDSTVTVFMGGDYEQGEETPALIADDDSVIIAVKNNEQAARWWMIQ